MRRALLLLLASTSLAWGGRQILSAKADLERAVEAAYVDRGRVARKSISVGGENVEYLEAGPADAARVVVFCHGSAFSASTWQSVGVLDAVAEAGARAIALDLPGYGRSSKTIANGAGKEGYLLGVAKALDLPRELVVVAASMGGSYALPFVVDQNDAFRVAGYVTAAGSVASSERVAAPVLGVYGSEDGRLRTDRPKFGSQFSRSQLVVFENAPHPSYLRDAAAAARFSELVVAFVTGDGAAADPPLTIAADWGD